MKKRAPSRSRSSNRTRSRSASHRRVRPQQTRGASTRRRSGGGGRTRRSAQLTTDHDQIRRWAEERGGHPATVKGTVKSGQAVGMLRIDFPGYSGQQTLREVSWDEWFQIFEERRLGLLVQERTAGGKPSRFNKLVCRD